MRNDPDVKLLEHEADNKVCNLVHLMYRSKSYEGIAKGLRVLPADDGGALEIRI
jgi:Patatin phospholipase